MRFLGMLILSAGLWAQPVNAPSDAVRAAVARLELERYKAHIKGLTEFGDRTHGTQHNRDAIDWLEKQLRGFGYSNVERHLYTSGFTTQENIYATKVGTTIPGEMYLVSAHMDGRGGGEAADDDASGCAVVLELARVLGMPGVETNRSVRFVFWNGEEAGLVGSSMYVRDRKKFQGTATEPKWIGMIQFDMTLFDHGTPPGPKQSANADINIEYQAQSSMAGESAMLAAALQSANRSYAPTYPATIGANMADSDSTLFMNLVPTVSVRENEKRTGIGVGSNPNYHQPTDRYGNYGEEDFRFGFNSAQTTLGALGHLAGIALTQPR